MGTVNSLVVAGPTASGKTALACQAALRLDGEIISADSRQVYRGMDIGTGKDLDEYIIEGREIPFHLIDVADPSSIFTLYQYQQEFYRVFDGVVDAGHLPIICGGTGLYIEAVIRGYSLSSVGEDREFREKMMSLPKDELEKKLRGFPAMYEATDLSSKKRIVRALEIARGGEGEDNVRYQPRHSIHPLVILLMTDPEVLKERITLRLDQRLANGMVEEVSSLLESGVRMKRMEMLGMEYKWITRYITKKISYEEMKESLRRDIFRLAKRQRTWFRGMEKRGVETAVINSPDIDQVLELYQNSVAL